ncbi:P-loop containing nucleoside triphosphate hydrolase superfamily protein [Zea mays]|uniref:p-loop containing nucleoside triphosphate hydrolase superfamily protein n=1 Tax=Zea mays TaxID=4577 RepID=A0A1D6NYT4_MAIZE|nr:P-loop containing nucleoside triphosphate hydrolase superfamily protein [Zea mays]
MIILDVPSVGGRLMLVDMAGSENIEAAGQTGFEAKMQTAKINQGNTALKRVVESIANGDSHVPFRDSKLTMLLQDSFEDDKSKILMILCASPDAKELHKTVSTLEYGAKAKCIVRVAHAATPRDKMSSEESSVEENWLKVTSKAIVGTLWSSVLTSESEQIARTHRRMARFERSGRQGRLMRELINLSVSWSWSVGERDAALRHRISHRAMRQCPTRGTASSTWGQARRACSSAHHLRVSSVGGLLGSQVPHSRGCSPWGRIRQTHRPFAPGP